MAPRNPKPGDLYRLAGDAPYGSDEHAMPAGTVVTVREVVDAGTPGAHDDSEDAVVVEWEQPTVIYVDGTPELGVALRAVSFGLDYFRELFTATEA